MVKVHNRNFVEIFVLLAITYLLSACDSSGAFSQNEHSDSTKDPGEVKLLSIDISLVSSTGYKDINGIDIVGLGRSYQVKSVGTYDDGSTRELTDIGQWIDTAPLIATISSIGEGIGLSEGFFTLTQEYDGVESNSLQLKVSIPKMVFWGTASHGGQYQGDDIINVKEVYANREAFFIVKNDGTGQVVTEDSQYNNYDAVKEYVTDIQSVAVIEDGFGILKNDGSVVSWGRDVSSDNSSKNLIGLTDVVEIFPRDKVTRENYFYRTFNALKSDGQLVSWGRYSDTSEVDHLLTNVKAVYHNFYASAAVKEDGNVVVWGDDFEYSTTLEPKDVGADQTALPNNLNDVEEIYATKMAFAAKKSDGTVVVWGDPMVVAGTNEVQAELIDIETIDSSGNCFIATKKDKTVVLWGNGADVVSSACYSDSQDTSKTVVGAVKIAVALGNTTGAESMAVLQSNGHVIVWGHEGGAGDITGFESQLTDIVDVISSDDGYAVLKSDGTVFSWGAYAQTYQGFDDVKDQLIDVKTLYSSLSAFAAVKEDGTVVTWGSNSRGGDSSSVSDKLINVESIYSTDRAFSAIAYY